MTDAETVPALLEQVENPVESAAADGAYDRQVVYDALEGRSARAVVPPRRDAKIKRHGNTSGPRLARDENLRRIRQVGRSAWKEESGYHERSLAETAMFRMKTIFGDGVASRCSRSAGDRGGGAVPGVEHHDPPGDAAERAGCGVIPWPEVGERPVRSQRFLHATTHAKYTCGPRPPFGPIDT